MRQCADLSLVLSLQLIAKRHASAHIIAFVAGPCGFSQGDVPGLASRLQGTRLDVVMLAPAAEVGSNTMQALQSLVDCLNGDAAGSAISEKCSSDSLAPKASAPAADSGRQSSSVSAAADSAQSPSGGLEACGHTSCANGSALIRWQEPEAAETRAGRASRLLFIQPPQEGMEVWQQLEPFMEMLEASETPPNHQESGPPAEAEAHTLIPGGSPNPDQPPAPEVPTPAPAANTTHLWQQEQQQVTMAPFASVGARYSTCAKRQVTLAFTIIRVQAMGFQCSCFLDQVKICLISHTQGFEAGFMCVHVIL